MQYYENTMMKLAAGRRRYWLNSIWIVSILIVLCSVSFADVVMDESFEGFSTGSIDGQNGWVVSNGVCSITDDSSDVQSGSKAAHFTASNQKLVVYNTSFGGSETGVSGILYVDMWVKINSMETKDFGINGYDLFGNSEKRAFVLEFDTPSGNGGDFRIYDGSSKTVIGGYVLGEWYRISAQIDYMHEVYTGIFNGGDAVTVGFREDYTPTASGNRQADVKEYHELRINLGYDGATGSVDAVIDNIYIGTDPIPDVVFPEVEITYSIDVEQPEIGSISLDPALDEYSDSSEVTATLTLPDGYRNEGWTGDLSGTELVKTFTITRNMTIGANVGIDPDNPPVQYTITVNQPDTGSISLYPAGGIYYKYTPVTASIDVPVGYLFEGWTGDLSGTDPEQTIVIESDLTIGATVVPDTTPPTIYTVSNADDFEDICEGTLRPGDIIEVLDGEYDCGGITIESSGTSNKPIIIRSKNLGGAVLNGETYFDLRRVGYLQIEGFDFQSNKYTLLKLQACNNVRITNNHFHATETDGQNGKWILIGGIWDDPSAASHHNRIDHNIFEDKHQLGNFITLDGQQDPYNQMTQYDRIDHNYFRNIGPRADNEMEAIRVGVSTLSMSSAYCTIEYNLFEECNGDPEIISVKSCDNVIRYNTFRRNEGTLCLRHGNRNEVYGNFFFGEGMDGTGGIRVYGNDHLIYNNYFEGLTGTKWDAPITLTNGDYDGEDSGSLSSHWRVKRAIICHNTLVNNDHNIEIGYTNNGNYGKSVKDVVMANNLVVGKQNELVKIITEPENMQWRNNIMFADSVATLGITAGADEILVADPIMIQSGKLWRIASGSPAIDAATNDYDFVTNDIDGQARDTFCDIGADEFSSAEVVIFPLEPENVGPNAVDTVVTELNVRIVPDKFRLLNNYPNPFNPVTTIVYSVEKAGKVELAVYNVRGQRVAVLCDRTMVPGNYSIKWNAGDIPSGVYWLRMETGEGVSVLPVSLLK